VQIPAGLLLNGFDMFLLVFVRMTGLFVVAPIFGRRNIPTLFKIGFSFFTALILVNTTVVKNIQYDNNILGYALLIIKEFMIGLSIGFVAYLAYTAFYIAGEIIDRQIGFGIVNVLDPISNIQVPVTSNLYFIISMLMFLTINGHHMLILTLFDSFTTLPLGTALFNKEIVDGITGLFTTVLATGFKIAAPIVASILITDIALGTISKMVPQINIFVIGMPLKIIVGMVILIITIPAFISIMETVYKLMNSSMLDYIKELGPK
jgi:flagellar biosynthetic protein FliR